MNKKVSDYIFEFLRDRAGVDTVLVLSGEATMKDYSESDVKPTYVINHIKEIK